MSWMMMMMTMKRTTGKGRREGREGRERDLPRQQHGKAPTRWARKTQKTAHYRGMQQWKMRLQLAVGMWIVEASRGAWTRMRTMTSHWHRQGNRERKQMCTPRSRGGEHVDVNTTLYRIP